jgi:excisionase family DNA binding protein
LETVVKLPRKTELDGEHRSQDAFSIALPRDVVEQIASEAASIAVAALAEHPAVTSRGWLTVQGAAQYLGLPKHAVYKLTARKAIPFSAVGQRLLFHPDELDRWLVSLRDGPWSRETLRRAHGDDAHDAVTLPHGGATA